MLFTRINKTVKGLLAIAKNPWLLNHVLADNDLWKKQVADKYKLDSLPVVDITRLFPGFNEELSTFAFLEGGSSPADLALIKGLCKSVPNCKYFEIGTCRGESVVNVADVCSLCYTLDLNPKDVNDKTEAELIGFFSKKDARIKQLYGDSRTFDFAGLNQKFDVVFIDGNHHYEYVKGDTENVFEHLLHENSIVIWHDYGFDAVSPRFETMAAILDGMPAEKRKNLYHISNTICAVYINKDLPTSKLRDVRIPDKKFNIKLESRPL